MFIKLFIRMIVVVGAVVLPILFFSVSDIWAGAKNAFATLTDGKDETKTAAPATHIVNKPTGPPLTGPDVRDFGEIFRFDVSVPWIMSRWSHVSSGLDQLQLQGYRVPLVTGTRGDDLAGSLTYYFGPEQRVRKITFTGTTGNVSRLVQLLTRRYGFRRRLANDGGLFVYEVPSKTGKGIRSILNIRPNGVLKAEQPYQRFYVDLILEQPEKT